MLVGTLIGKCVCTTLALYAFSGETRLQLKFRPISMPQLLVSSILLIVIGVLVLSANFLLPKYMHSPVTGLNHVMDVIVNTWSKLAPTVGINFLGAVVLLRNLVVIPIYEEFMFRSVLHTIFRKWCGEPAAILCVAIVFSLFHLDIPTPIPVAAFLFSIALSVVALRVRSLIPGCIAHGVVNFVAMIVYAGQKI